MSLFVIKGKETNSSFGTGINLPPALPHSPLSLKFTAIAILLFRIRRRALADPADDLEGGGLFQILLTFFGKSPQMKIWLIFFGNTFDENFCTLFRERVAGNSLLHPGRPPG